MKRVFTLMTLGRNCQKGSTPTSPLADHMLVSEIEREQRLKRNFLLFSSTLLTGGSNQKYCMLSRFVNLYNNTESAIPPGGGFPFLSSCPSPVLRVGFP